MLRMIPGIYDRFRNRSGIARGKMQTRQPLAAVFCRLSGAVFSTVKLFRIKLLHEWSAAVLEEEIPHGIAVAVERMEFKEHIVNIDATIICERDSHKGIIIGKQGSMLKKIGSQARRDIEDMLECQVNLQLWVKVKKDWRDSDFLLKNFGYNPADTRPDR